MTNQHRFSLALSATLVLAAWLRFFHLDHGLTETLYVDAARFVGQGALIVATGRLEPVDYLYPGLFANLLALFYWLGDITTIYGRYLAAHVILAVMGVSLVATTYALARRVANQEASLFAALLAAVCTTSVTYSRLPAPDVMMTLFMTLAFVLMLSPQQSKSRALLLGVTTGLALGTKFTALYLLPFVMIVPLVQQVKQDRNCKTALKYAFVTWTTAILCFTATTPYFWARIVDYFGWFLHNLRIQKMGQIGHVQGGYADYLFSATLTWEMPWIGSSLLANFGWPFLLLLAAAMVSLVINRQRTPALLAIYAGLYLLLISGPGRLKAFRFLLPVLPALFVLAAWALQGLTARLAARYRSIAGILVAMLVLFQPAAHTWSYLLKTWQPTTNELAMTWGQQNLVPGSSILLSPFYVNNLMKIPMDYHFVPDAGSRIYRSFSNHSGPEQMPLFSENFLEQLQSAGVRYVIMTSYVENWFTPTPENKRFFPQSVYHFAAFKSALQRESILLHTIWGAAEGRIGPDIFIYELVP